MRMGAARVAGVILSCGFVLPLTAACGPEPVKEPGPESMHLLPQCEDAARLAHTAARDCTFVYGGIDLGPSNWLRVRFSPPGARPDGGAVVIDSYTPDRTELGVVRETGVVWSDYPFRIDVTGEGGDDVFVPLARADGRKVLSVWLSNFLDDYYHHTGVYRHAGEIPLGFVLHLDRNLFVDTASPGFKGPWSLTLFRADPSAITPLADLVADGDLNIAA